MRGLAFRREVLLLPIVGIACFQFGLLYCHRWQPKRGSSSWKLPFGRQKVVGSEQLRETEGGRQGLRETVQLSKNESGAIFSWSKNGSGPLFSDTSAPPNIAPRNRTSRLAAPISSPMEASPIALKEVTRRVCVKPSICFDKLTVTAANLNHSHKFRLSALLFTRANYTRDTMQHQFREVREWMEWMFYGGMDHVFLYDNCQGPGECLRSCLEPYIREGLVTYMTWNPPERYHDAQEHCYNDWPKEFKSRSHWQITADMDEYPYIKSDIEPNFLLRLTEKHRCSIYFQNQFFLDVRKPKLDGEFLMERILRKDRNYERYPSRSKVLYQPEFVTKVNVHSVDMQSGCHERYVIPIEQGGLQHYWGYRNINERTNISRFLSNTLPDDSMIAVARHFKSKHVPKVRYHALHPTCRAYEW